MKFVSKSYLFIQGLILNEGLNQPFQKIKKLLSTYFLFRLYRIDRKQTKKFSREGGEGGTQFLILFSHATFLH